MFLIFLSLLITAAVAVNASTVSFSATGHWSNTTEWHCKRFMCSSNHKTWVPNNPNFKFYDERTGCAALLRKNISLIEFYGDSYLRQLYAGLLITLNGDYQYGSLSNQSKSQECEYNKQFYEKKCSVRQLNHHGLVCDGKILLDPLLTGIDNLRQCSGKKGTVLLWSFGNHKLGAYRYGVNNATAYQDFFRNGICKHVVEKSENEEIDGSFQKACSLWWVSTHFRRVGFFPDEKEDVVREYNLGMRHFFDSRSCGLVNYIDTYNMTSELVKEMPDECQQLTYDSVHWGMEVNLVKAQIVLNALLQNT
jgi:hypothetical protein